MPVPIPNKRLTIPSGTDYAYIHYPPSTSRPTLLFLHGFPSTSHDWHFQIIHFRAEGYGILAPDLLGYGGSSKPLNPEAYLGSIMSADIISILDHEGITEKVIGIAHDWGTYLLSQLAFRYPERFEKFVFLSVAYGPPGQVIDIPRVNIVTRRRVGFERYGYWLFLSADGAGKTIGENWESFFSLVHPENPSIWKTAFAPVDVLKEWLTKGLHTHTASYVTQEDKEYHHEAFGDDYSAAVTWYKRGIRNLGVDDERRMLERGEIANKGIIGKDTLMVTGLGDLVCDAEMAKLSMRKYIEKGKLKVVDLDAGHWIMLEKANDTNRVLQQFFAEGVGIRSAL